MKQNKNIISRRTLLKNSLMAATAVAAPTIVPASVFGANAPSKRINIAMIGMGRQAKYANLPPFLHDEGALVRAVCDVDQWRLDNAKKQVDDFYKNKDCIATQDWRELIARDDIDAVMNSTPDHSHVPISLAAVRAGKHTSCEKPLTLTIAEGRELADAVKKHGVVFRTDSECRSDIRIRHACELALNGYLGKIKHIVVSVPAGDVGGGNPAIAPVPAGLDYDMWLGSAPKIDYCLDRVHPVKSYGRPGWMRFRDYCEGMVTNWGTHVIDAAQWGNGTERTGPVEVEGSGTYPTEGLWNVLTDFKLQYKYGSGVILDYLISRPSAVFVRFIGEEGWFQTNWMKRTMEASDEKLIRLKMKETDIQLPSRQDKEDFIYGIKTGKPVMEDAEIGHRSCSMCQLGHIAIQRGKKLRWDPKKEKFIGDKEANKMLHRPYRDPWGLDMGITKK